MVVRQRVRQRSMGESVLVAASGLSRTQRRQRSAFPPAPLQRGDPAEPPYLFRLADGDAEPGRQGRDLQLEHERVGPLRPVRGGSAAALSGTVPVRNGAVTGRYLGPSRVTRLTGQTPSQ